MSQIIDTTDFAPEAAEWIARKIVEGQRGGGTFGLSLCGGSTPKPVYAVLAGRPEIDWSRVMITFGDERCVPPDHPESNYRMAKEALLYPAGVPEENVNRMEGEREPVEAATRCEARLRGWAAENGEEIFRHDLVLLGMGEDGHTASLFPGTAALTGEDRWIRENFVPKFDSWRLTFTLPLINAARSVAFLVTGEAKRSIVDEVLGGVGDHPAGKVAADELFWLLG